MTWTPISGTIPQYSTAANALASDYYLKFYQAGTSTAFNMATDSTGSTTLDKCQLNTNGQPSTDGTAAGAFIPRVNQKYRIVLYKNSADADADNTTNAFYDQDNVEQNALKDDGMIVFNTEVLMAASTDLTVGDRVRTLGYSTIGDGGGNDYEIVAASTGTHDGGSYINLATHQAKGLFPGCLFNVKQWGAVADGATDDSTEIQAAIDYINTIGGGVLCFPESATSYYITSSLTLYNRITLDLCGVSIIEQGTDGIEIIDMTGETAYTARANIINGRLQYTNQQTVVGGSAILIGSGSTSGAQNFKLENLAISYAYHAVYVPDGKNIFLCELKNVTSVNSDYYAYYIGGGASVHTNVTMDNVWAVQNSGSERSTSRGFYIANVQELNANNIAVDRAQALPISIETSQGTVTNVVLEDNVRTASSGGVASMVRMTNSKINLGYTHLTGNTVTLTGTTSIGIIYNDNSEINSQIVRDYNTDLTIGTGTYYTFYSVNGGVTYNRFADSDGTSPAIATNDTSANTPAQIKTLAGTTHLLELDGINVGTKGSAPSTTGYPEYSIVLNNAATAGSALGWRRIGADWIPIDYDATDTTTNLADVSASINTINKYAGRRVFNTTTSKPVWATGSAAGDTWVDATGSTAHTPV